MKIGQIYYPMQRQDKTPDRRYTVSKEYCGYPKPKIVLRFCDKWIDCFDTLNDAVKETERHNVKRLGVAPPQDLLNYVSS